MKYASCELDIYGSFVNIWRVWLQTGTGWKFVQNGIFHSESLSLSSKCCDWDMANHFKQGFLFLPSSLGLTWLEHGFVLVSSSLIADGPSQLAAAQSSHFSLHMVSTADSHWLVPKRPVETLIHAFLLCLKTKSLTQNQPGPPRNAGVFLIVYLELIMTGNIQATDWCGVSVGLTLSSTHSTSAARTSWTNKV